jgi:hypothetical protein
MSWLELWELSSYVVTVVALPWAIVLFWYEQRRERQTEEEEIYQRLSDEYADFSKTLLENADLRLITGGIPDDALSPEQHERKQIIFELLMSLFERAFILVYEPDMNAQQKRLWASWQDYIDFWCNRPDFRAAAPRLLQGEDPDFGRYIRKILSEYEDSNLLTPA